MYMFMFVICLHEIKVNNFDNFGNALEQLNISTTSEKLQAQYQRIKIVEINIQMDSSSIIC